MKKTMKIVAASAALALILTGCATNEQAGPSDPKASGAKGTLTGKGASSMKAAQERWIADYQTQYPAITINYSPDGSGAGRESFIAGAVDFAGSDRPLKDAEMGAGKFKKCSADSNVLNLPVFVAPIAVAFQVDGVAKLRLDAETLAGIFTGQITDWSDAKLAALNPGVTLPKAPITAVHRSDDSGTTENFVDYLAQAAPTAWTAKVSGVWPAEYQGEAAKGTSGVISVLKNSKNAIGYAEEAQAKSQGLALAEIKVGDKFYGPTAAAAAKIVDTATRLPGRSEADHALKLNRKAEGAYPMALVSYLIVCEKYADPAVGSRVREYLSYLVSATGQASAGAAAGSAPLSSEYRTKLEAAVATIK